MPPIKPLTIFAVPWAILSLLALPWVLVNPSIRFKVIGDSIKPIAAIMAAYGVIKLRGYPFIGMTGTLKTGSPA